MADKFRAGQRVRIVDSKFYPECVGNVCVIAGQPYLNYFDKKMYPLVDELDAAEECLEPVDDGSEKSSWSECLWKPKPIVHSIEDEITTDTGGE